MPRFTRRRMVPDIGSFIFDHYQIQFSFHQPVPLPTFGEKFQLWIGHDTPSDILTAIALTISALLESTL